MEETCYMYRVCFYLKYVIMHHNTVRAPSKIFHIGPQLLTVYSFLFDDTFL